jgi:hypothetical protein
MKPVNRKEWLVLVLIWLFALALLYIIIFKMNYLIHYN